MRGQSAVPRRPWFDQQPQDSEEKPELEGGDSPSRSEDGSDLPDEPEVLTDVPDAPPAPEGEGDSEQ